MSKHTFYKNIDFYLGVLTTIGSISYITTNNLNLKSIILLVIGITLLYRSFTEK